MKKIFIFFIYFIVIIPCSAQIIERSVVSSSGESFKTSIGAISWTLGEVADETYSGSSFTINQGFQQGNLNITFPDHIAISEMEVSVFPNPTTQFVKLTLKNSVGIYIIQVTDASGRVLFNTRLEVGEVEKQLDFTNYAEGIYFISIRDIKANTLDTYKITKI